MKLLDGQVHVAELVLLTVFTVLAFLIGTSLPLVAMIALVLWPLLVLQMILQGVVNGLVVWWCAKRHVRGPPPAPRHGVARYLWLAPLISVTLGYAFYVVTTGRWFL